MVAKKTSPQDSTIGATGRRKTAVARVRIKSGSGKITVNEREYTQYFPTASERLRVRAPLEAVDLGKALDVDVKAHGGGIAAQAGAISLGIARAIGRQRPELLDRLRAGGFLTRDSRAKERKKYGRMAARRSFQFSKR
jgi:small subunit ribosomal protein S9